MMNDDAWKSNNDVSRLLCKHPGTPRKISGIPWLVDRLPTRPVETGALFTRTTRVHGPCWQKALHDNAFFAQPVTVSMGRVHGRLFTLPVNTARIHGWQKYGRAHGPWTRVVCTELNGALSCWNMKNAPGLWDDLERETPGFISPDLWPPSSSDFNPIYYTIWGLMHKTILLD